MPVNPKTYFFCAIFFLFGNAPLGAQHTLVRVFGYIQQYSNLAVEQMAEYGIPASVTLAQAIVESACGDSDLAIRSNNHFGIKCQSQWEGDTVLKTDDAANECFRKYKSVSDSYTDHSLILRSRRWYADLFELPLSDYRSWCHGLKRAGYATNPAYAEELILTIERYRLYEYDMAVHLEPLAFSMNVPDLKTSSAAGKLSSPSDLPLHNLLLIIESDISALDTETLIAGPSAGLILASGK
jgi:hypothetical protein